MPYISIMRSIAAVAFLLLAALTVSADPTITSIEPSVGLTYGLTTVTIRGTEFSESDFSCEGQNEPFCPSEVFFDSARARVVEVTPTSIKLLVHPRPHGDVANVTVKVVRKGEVTRERAFRWDQTATSSDPEHYVRYLIPVASRNLRGANGSVWDTEWRVSSGYFLPFPMIWPYCPPNVSPCPSPVISANTTIEPSLFPRGDGTDGVFVHVPKAVDPFIGMSLRVRDLSLNAGNFGTEIPIVAPEDYSGYLGAPLQLVDIPTDEKYRATLRIYGYDQSPIRVMVNVYAQATNERIEQYMVDLTGIVTAAPELFPQFPSYAQLDPLTPAVRASGERVRITLYSALWDSLISPQPALPTWGFVTLTNNETQQVTTVTPK